MQLKNALVAIIVVCAVGGARLVDAQEDLPDGTVLGEGRAIATGDSASVRSAAKNDAIRDAVLKSIKDATALDAGNEQFIPIVKSLQKQIRTIKVLSEDVEDGEMVTKVEIVVDRGALRMAIRGTDLDKLNDRSFSILYLGEEYVAKSNDPGAPKEETIEYHKDVGSSYRDHSVKAASASASSSSAVAASSSVNAASASNANIHASESVAVAAQGRNGSVVGAAESDVSGSASSTSSLQAKQSFAAAAQAKSQSSAIDAKAIDKSSHDVESYKKTVKYQDNSAPDKTQSFFPEVTGMMGGGGYDLKILNPAAARGEFLANKKLTNSLLQDPVEVGKFIDYARTKQHADFLMTGTAMITIDPAADPATGLLTCTARIEVVGYATAGHEQIIGKSVPFYSSGNTPEACRANVSKKAAKVVAPDLARQALTYWSNRAARGRQYLVRLKGVNMPMPMRLAFTRALNSIEGVSDVESREGDGSSLEATITLKGKVQAMDVVYTAVSSQAAFAGKTLDGAETGEALTLCLGKCAPEPAKKK